VGLPWNTPKKYTAMFVGAVPYIKVVTLGPDIIMLPVFGRNILNVNLERTKHRMKNLITVLVASLALLLPSLASAKNVKINLNTESRYVMIKGPVRTAMSEDIVRQIYEFDKGTSAPIYYIINTNGGSLVAGNQIIRAMESAKSPSICIVDRAAYSMGALILSHCDTAYIHKDASVIFHEGYIGAEGRVSEVFSYLDFEKKEFDRLNAETAALLKMKLKDYVAKQKDEWWLTAKDAEQVGLVDGIVTSLKYPLPPKEEFSLFSLFGFEWSPKDGYIDMTYYPLNEKSPYTRN
jgi:ATP-dependent protease ClpP protease subunit